MVTHRSALRLALNIGLDGVLAALAVPLSRWLIQPMGDPFTPAWTVAWGAVALLAAGTPFRLSSQYWRFATLGDLVGVAAASVAGAALYTLGLIVVGTRP